MAAGDAMLDTRITQRLIDEIVASPPPDARPALTGLTARELEVPHGVGRGQSNAEIAAATHLSEATVKTYLGRVLTKTGRRDRAQLVVLPTRPDSSDPVDRDRGD